MAQTDLVELLHTEFKKAVENSALQNPNALVLCEQLFTTSLSDLLMLPSSSDIHYTILLNSLILHSMYKNSKVACENLAKISDSYSFLISAVPIYKEVFDQSFISGLLTLSCKVINIKDVFAVAISVNDLKKAEVDVTTLFTSLYSQFTKYIWDLITVIYSDMAGRENDIADLIGYLIRAEDFSFDTGPFKDRIFDIIAQFTEYETDYFGMLSAGNKINPDYLGVKKILGLSQYLLPCSAIFFQRIQKYQEKIGFLIIRKEEINKIPNESPLEEYTKSDTPLYAREHGNVNISLYRGNLRSGTKIVVKIYKKLNDMCDLLKFAKEVEIFKILSEKASKNSAFLKFYGASFQEDKLILLMECCDMDLMYKITEMKAKNERFSIDQVSEIAFQLINSFAELVQLKIFHKDIKPHNILINEDLTVKITDFSVSEIKIDSSGTRATNNYPIQGTIGYMAPELEEAIFLKKQNISDVENYDAEKADVFSLGLTILQMVIFEDLTTLNLKENHHKLMGLVDAVSPHWLVTLLSHMLMLKPQDRSTFNQLLRYFPQTGTMAT